MIPNAVFKTDFSSFLSFFSSYLYLNFEFNSSQIHLQNHCCVYWCKCSRSMLHIRLTVMIKAKMNAESKHRHNRSQCSTSNEIQLQYVLGSNAARLLHIMLCCLFIAATQHWSGSSSNANVLSTISISSRHTYMRVCAALCIYVHIYSMFYVTLDTSALGYELIALTAGDGVPSLCSALLSSARLSSIPSCSIRVCSVRCFEHTPNSMRSVETRDPYRIHCCVHFFFIIYFNKWAHIHCFIGRTYGFGQVIHKCNWREVLACNLFSSFARDVFLQSQYIDVRRFIRSKSKSSTKVYLL